MLWCPWSKYWLVWLFLHFVPKEVLTCLIISSLRSVVISSGYPLGLVWLFHTHNPYHKYNALILKPCPPPLEQRADIETIAITLRHTKHNTTANHLPSATVCGCTPGKRFWRRRRKNIFTGVHPRIYTTYEFLDFCCMNFRNFSRSCTRPSLDWFIEERV